MVHECVSHVFRRGAAYYGNFIKYAKRVIPKKDGEDFVQIGVSGERWKKVYVMLLLGFFVSFQEPVNFVEPRKFLSRSLNAQ